MKISDMENGTPVENFKHQDDEDAESTAIILPPTVDEDGHVKRTGNLWTASAHVITAVIGSGVLSLAWSMAQLGWIAGPIVLAAFAFVTYYTSVLLADCYRSPDPVTGKRNYTYMDAVRANLGGSKIFLCGLVQYTNLVGTSIGYTITASISMVAIRRSDCFHEHGDDAACHVSNNIYMAIFGVVQILLSQIPDFNRIWWLSIVAAIMSFSYSFIGLALSIARSAEGGHSRGTIGGAGTADGLTEARKLWQVFQALGNVAFAYSFSMILIEIQDTLKAPPPENKTMKKASLLGVLTTTAFYMSVGCFGYLAFGNKAPGNLLTGFGFYNPYWLVDFANACIVVHLVGAYQVYCQPIFAFVEDYSIRQWPKSHILHIEHDVRIPYIRPFKITAFRLIFRTIFVITTTVVSMLLPFFNDVLGLLGALAFWPLTVYFPVTMYISQARIRKWTAKWTGLQILNVGCLIISIAAALGSVEGIILSLKNYTPFKTHY